MPELLCYFVCIQKAGGEAHSIWDEDRAQTVRYKNKARENMLHIVYSDEDPLFSSIL